VQASSVGSRPVKASAIRTSRSRGCVRRVRLGALQATICFQRLLVRSATTRCRLQAGRFHAVLLRSYELATGVCQSGEEVEEDQIAWAMEVALAEFGVDASELRPTYAVVVSSGCLAGAIESPTTSSLTQALAWRWRLHAAREHGRAELQKAWMEVLGEPRPGHSRPLSMQRALVRVHGALQRHSARRHATTRKAQARRQQQAEHAATLELHRCAAADARLKVLVVEAGKRWEGMLSRAFGVKGLKRPRLSSRQSRQRHCS
ncbi:unnamed protein product, partial [Symbiodinium pilosum]